MSVKYEDALGDMLKSLERIETDRCVQAGECAMVRLDGMAFANYTASMKKPYDEIMADCMKATAARLLEHFSPDFVYTQSDEITLVFAPENVKFNGRLQKMAGACASKATSFFLLEMTNRIIDVVEQNADKLSGKGAIAVFRDMMDRNNRLAPAFDGRAVGTSHELAAAFLVWREIDAARNGALNAGTSVFSQSQLGGKSPADIKDMLLEIGVDYEAYPNHFRRGTLMRKRKVEMRLTEEELMRIPEHIRESKRAEVYMRSRVVEIEERPRFFEIENLQAFAFDDEPFVLAEKPFGQHIVP